PYTNHMHVANMLLRYLKHTSGQGILFRANSDTKLHAYVDANWGSCTESRRSTTDFCIFLGNSLVSWKAKRQKIVNRSSAEAEYRSSASVSTTIHIASNPIFHERTKHLEIDLHFVREKVSQGILKFIHVRKYHQLADIFTKALPRNTF
ncbi:Retrovirus-related Pol polyprotein from transposon TNT 1-94, partial [Glycine soja]